MKRNDQDLLEYGIYHWNLNTGTSLPGVTNGMPGEAFFGSLGTGNHDPREVSRYLEDTVSGWTQSLTPPSLMLCSGGVDSSILAATATRSGYPFEILHTAYIAHDNNDLQKLTNVIEAFPSFSYVCSLGPDEYLEGLKILWGRHYHQNTYAPTIAFALSKIPAGKFAHLVTGSGPDELFYGMEKYNWDFFKSRESLPIAVALEEIDVAYNLSAYREIVNTQGKALLEEVRNARRALYKRIGETSHSIYDAQRLLAYCTVTAQHVSLFDSVAKINGMQHNAPFLTEEFIRIALAIPIEKLINPDHVDGRVEIGKFHLKKYLSGLMSGNHAFSKKIGFHAPTTKYMHSPAAKRYFETMDYDALPAFLDKDKTKALVRARLENVQITDYFLYSILNLSRLCAAESASSVNEPRKGASNRI